MEEITCDQCGKTTNKYGIKAHKWKAHTEEGLKQKPRLGSIPWNKGQTKESNDTLARVGAKVSETHRGKTFRSSTEAIEAQRREKISAKMQQVGGGYRRGSGRGKKGWYKGFWCDSSYELAFVIYCLEHKIPFVRNTEKFPYTYGGKERSYIPDFIIGKIFIEVKGYHNAQVEAKLQAFPHSIMLLDATKMKPLLEYTTQRYGKNFISLYT